MYFSGRIRGFPFDTYSVVMVDLFEVNLNIFSLQQIMKYSSDFFLFLWRFLLINLCSDQKCYQDWGPDQEGKIEGCEIHSHKKMKLHVEQFS